MPITFTSPSTYTYSTTNSDSTYWFAPEAVKWASPAQQKFFITNDTTYKVYQELLDSPIAQIDKMDKELEDAIFGADLDDFSDDGSLEAEDQL